MYPEPRQSYSLEKIKRLPGRRPRMTFILGMKCSDGIVICGDRMEADGFSVRQRPKLEVLNVGNEWGVCWGGSGTSNPIDRFSAQLYKALGNDSFNKEFIEKKVDSCLKFIKNNNKDEYIKIVLGVFGRRVMKPKKGAPYLGHLEQVLYSGDSESCCISPEREWCCAGLDSTLTKFLMASSFHRGMDVLEAQQLGIWVTGLMKKYAAGVGGPTDVAFSIPGFGAWLNMEEANVAKMENRYAADDTKTYIGQYWAEWHPGSWSAKRLERTVQNYRRKLKRSISQRSKLAK